jgi:MarR family transcriptional regulator, 2-MHQ and catechol-resistance regulon repressor
MTTIEPKNEELSGVRIWLTLWKATRAMETLAAQSIEALEMCPSDFAVLEALLHKGALPVNAIGRKILLTSGSITTAVDRLEKKGLVERKNTPEDRRTRIVHLTREGRALITAAFAKHEIDMMRATAALTPEERVTLHQLLKKLGLGAEAALGKRE